MRYRTRILQATLMLLTLSAYSSSAWGAGYGLNLKYAHHNSGVLKNVSVGRGLDFKANLGGIGLTVDTNVARDDVLNYRVELNLEYGSFDFGSITDDDDRRLASPKRDGIGIGLNQTLGFGFVRNENVRLWMGPALRFGLHDISEDIDGLEVELGAGLELGLNIHVGDRISLSPTVGYQYMLQYIEFDLKNSGDEGFLGGAHRVTVGVAILFRSVSDVFKGRSRRGRGHRR